MKGDTRIVAGVTNSPILIPNYRRPSLRFLTRRTHMTKPLLLLKTYGQSVWYDNIDRAQLVSGQFKRLLDEDGVVGVTANPTIFQKSISHGNAYDEQMTQLIKEGKSTSEIYEALVLKDICTVADLLHPIYERTNRKD